VEVRDAAEPTLDDEKVDMEDEKWITTIVKHCFYTRKLKHSYVVLWKLCHGEDKVNACLLIEFVICWTIYHVC